MAFTRDATSGRAIPQTAAEWTSFLAAIGSSLSAPQFLWLLQMASGNAADSIGSCTLTAANSPGYQAAVSGWTTKAVTWADNGTARFDNTTTPPNGNAASLALLGYYYISATPTTNRFMGSLTDFAVSIAVSSAGKIEGFDNAIGTGTETVSDGVVRPYLIVYNRALTTCKLFYRRASDGVVETVDCTYASSAGAHTTIGAYPALTTPSGGCLYASQWTGTAAEMSDAQAIALVGSLWAPPAAAPYFTMTEPEVKLVRRTFRQQDRRAVQPIAPLGSPFVPTLGAGVEIPDNPPKGRPRTAHRAQAFALGPLPQGSPPPIPGRGPNGTVIVVQAEDGATVTWSWGTDVIPAHDGTEHRIGTTDCPRDSYAFSASLSDSQAQAVQSALIRRAAKAQVFLLGDMSEATTISSSSTGVSVNVLTTQYMDWIYAGSRVCVLDQDTGVVQSGVVQSSSSNQIVLDASVTVSYGDVIMPLRHVYLDAQQKLGSYAVNAARFDLTAKSFLYGDASSNWTINGATVATYNGVPVFTGGNEADQLVGRAFATGAETIDFGGEIQQYGAEVSAKIARELRYTIRTDADRQWLKAFLKAVQGKQIKFYLPTWRNDFAVTGTALGNQVITYSSTTQYAAQWSQTGAHNQVQIVTTTGTLLYRQIVASTDNGDGTESIQLDSGFSGSILAISFLEQCRLDQDDVVVTWEKAIGHTTIQAMTCKQ